MKRVKLIHEDLNAGGGAERLAAASLEASSELDLSVDLVTFTKPNWNQLERIFRISKLRKYVNNVIKGDINSLLDEHNKEDTNDNSDNEYDIVMNAHGDILPSHVFGQKKKKLITYCHYPLVSERLSFVTHLQIFLYLDLF